MKTAIVLFAAALSVAALSTNASAQKGFSSPKAVAAEELTDKNSNSSTKSKNPIKSSDIHFPETPNILVPKPRGGKEQVEIATPELVVNVSGLCCPGGTSYMTGSAGGTSWREVNGLPSPATFLTGGADTSFGTRSGGGFKLASETDEANPNDSPGPKPEAATAIEYGLIAALIGGTPDPGREGTYTTTTGEVNAAKTFDYCVIYPERCTVSEIERPTFGPHIITFDKLAGSADPGGDDI